MSVVEAEQFLLVDSNGALQAGLFATPNGPTMQFYDTYKRLRIAIGLVPGASSIQLYDADGRIRATVAAFDSGEPLVQLYDVTASVTKSL